MLSNNLCYLLYELGHLRLNLLFQGNDIKILTIKLLKRQPSEDPVQYETIPMDCYPLLVSAADQTFLYQPGVNGSKLRRNAKVCRHLVDH